MRRQGIAINDLGALVKPRIGEFVCGDNLHLNEAGYRACAEQAVELLEKYL